jgi:hypothetical protein
MYALVQPRNTTNVCDTKLSVESHFLSPVDLDDPQQLGAAPLRTTAIANELAQELRGRPVVDAARDARARVRLLDLQEG